jgi:hypothetical protein
VNSESSGTHEARLMVNTSMHALGILIDEHGLAEGIRLWAGRVATNAALLAAAEADGWELHVDEDESGEGEFYVYAARRFASSDEAIAAARVLGAYERTLGWRIGEEDATDPQADEYLTVGAEGTEEGATAGGFWKTVYTVEVLSEDTPLETHDLAELAYAIVEGDCSGQVEITETLEVDGKTMARLLEAQASDPAFFGLDEDGNPLEEG